MSAAPFDISDIVEWRCIVGPRRDHSGEPYPTHEGVLRIGNKEIRCYISSTGEVLLHGNDIAEFRRIVAALATLAKGAEG